jgi:hypothetical protein
VLRSKWFAMYSEIHWPNYSTIFKGRLVRKPNKEGTVFVSLEYFWPQQTLLSLVTAMAELNISL